MHFSDLVQTHSGDSGLLKFWKVNFARTGFSCPTQIVWQNLYLYSRDNLSITKTKHMNKKSLGLILYCVLSLKLTEMCSVANIWYGSH